MIVDCAIYQDGRRRQGDVAVADACEIGRDVGGFVWLGMHEPTPEEFDSVRREFDLHELAVEDAIKAHQRPKLEIYGDTVFVVLKTARYVDPEEVIETGEILLFVNPGFVVSVRHGQASDLHQVRHAIEARQDLLRCGPAAVLHAVIDRVVDDYAPVAAGVDTDIQQVEEEVFSPAAGNPAERIYKLEREVLEFHRAVAPLVVPLNRLVRGDVDLVPESLRSYYGDVHDHVVRLTQQIEGFRELLSSALQANLAQVTVRQNEDVRKISAWAAILGVPTAIAGIYGMNFEHMPELKWELGYPLVLVVIAVLCVWLHRRFRRAGWL